MYSEKVHFLCILGCMCLFFLPKHHECDLYMKFIHKKNIQECLSTIKFGFFVLLFFGIYCPHICTWSRMAPSLVISYLSPILFRSERRNEIHLLTTTTEFSVHLYLPSQEFTNQPNIECTLLFFGLHLRMNGLLG